MSLSHFKVWLGVILTFRTNTLHPFGNATIPGEVLEKLGHLSPLIFFKKGRFFVIRHLLRYGAPFIVICGFIRKKTDPFRRFVQQAKALRTFLNQYPDWTLIEEIRLPMEIVLFSNLATGLIHVKVKGRNFLYFYESPMQLTFYLHYI